MSKYISQSMQRNAACPGSEAINRASTAVCKWLAHGMRSTGSFVNTVYNLSQSVLINCRAAKDSTKVPALLSLWHKSYWCDLR